MSCDNFLEEIMDDDAHDPDAYEEDHIAPSTDPVEPYYYTRLAPQN